jgi:hypothetical protein
MIEKNMKEVNKYQLVLVEGDAKKSTPSHRTLTGRSDGNKRCVFAANEISLLQQNLSLPTSILFSSSSSGSSSLPSPSSSPPASLPLDDEFQDLISQYVTPQQRIPSPGDYVIFMTEESKGQTLYGKAIAITTLKDFHSLTFSRHSRS